MSFVSRLFYSKPPSSPATSPEGEDTASISSNGHVPQQSSPPSPPPPHPPRPLGSILRQPSPPGEARNGRQQSETRRVSFSSAPVKVATIPPNPPKENYHYRQQRNGITSRNGIRVPNGTAQQQQSLPPSGNNSNNNNNNSWFRSLFSSSAKTTASDNNSSSSSLTNGSLKSSSQKSFADGTGGSTEFRPLNNTQLLESIPLALTQSFDGRQLRLTDWEKGLGDNDEPEAALDAADYIDLISSQEQLANNLDILDSPPPFQLAQPKPFRLDSRKVGLLMFNRDGICGFSNIKSKPLELTLKKLLVQNIMEEVPTPKTATNPLLRARASPAMQTKKPLSEIPSSVTATLSAESRSKTDKAHIRGVDLSKLEMDVFNSTLAEMIFGAISIAQKPLKSMIDARYVNGAKLCAFKLHHLGTEWYDGSDPLQAEDLYISSFIIDATNADPRIIGLPIQCGVAILWLCPHSANTSAFSSSSSFSGTTSAVPPNKPTDSNGNVRSTELTLYNLLFNTPGFLMNALQLFAYDLFKLGIANIRTCFYWMLYRLVDFMNAVRLKGDLAEGETTDVLVDLLQRYDNKEHAFFVSNLLSTLFAFAYRQDRFKVVLWTSQADRLPMMCQVATLTSQFLARSVHQISDEVVITPDYRFVVPESLRTAEQFELQEEEEEEEDGGNTTAERANDAYANQETEFLNFQPIPAGSSCSSTLSTVTAIQVQTSGCSGVQTSSLVVESTTSTTISASGQSGGQQPPSHNCHSHCCNESKSSESHCQSRDESIGYDSLSESAISGNVSPVNNEEVVSYGGEDEEDGRQRGGAALEAAFSGEHSMSHDFKAFQKMKQLKQLQQQQQQQKHQQQQQQSDDLRALLNVSQTTDYEESDSSACFTRSSDTDTTASSDENNSSRAENAPDSSTTEAYQSSAEAVLSSSFNHINKTKQNYFRGYVDLRYKDGQQQEEGADEQENAGSKTELILAKTLAITAGSITSQSEDASSALKSTTTATTTTPKVDDNQQSSLPFSVVSFQTAAAADSSSSSFPFSSNASHFLISPESHVPASISSPSSCVLAETTTTKTETTSAAATLNTTLPVVQIRSTPFGTVALTSQSESTSSLHDASSSSSFSSSGSLSASASALYHFSWLSLPVITTQHLEMVTTQVIFGETLAQASTRQRDTTERNDSPPETYEYLLSRLSAKLKEEECNDTIFLVNCDTMAMNLLERALNEAPGSRCGPVMSSAVAAACERLLSLATIEGRRFQVWEFIRYTATQLLLKSEVLQSVLTHDLHLLMSSRSVKRNGNGSSSDTDLLLDIYINEETREYARKVWAELIGDQTVNVYLTSDGPKAAFDLFRFRVPTSALYLFSDYHLSTFYLPSATTTRLLDFDSSDLLVIVGLRKLFLRSREPLITAMHGRENAKTFDYLLKYPQFLKNNQNGSESTVWTDDISPRQNRSFSPLYKTVAFNVLLAGDLSSWHQNVSSFKTTSFSSKKRKQSKENNSNKPADQNVLLLQQ